MLDHLLREMRERQDHGRERVLRVAVHRSDRSPDQLGQLRRRHHEQATLTDVEVHLARQIPFAGGECDGGYPVAFDVRGRTAMRVPAKVVRQIGVGPEPPSRL